MSQGLTMEAGLGFLMKPQNSQIAHRTAQGFKTKRQNWKLCSLFYLSLGTDTASPSLYPDWLQLLHNSTHSKRIVDMF